VPAREVLSADELTWVARDERRWQQAAQIAAGDPDRDVAGIYRVLRNLEKNPPSGSARASSMEDFPPSLRVNKRCSMR
jgi:hypothetical protein